MKSPFQHQQQQMQRMQRDRMMGAAWQERQKAKKRKEEQARAPLFPDSSKFQQVEAEVAKLKKALASGKLTEKQFEERLNSLMFQDASGTWWMLGAETGAWYSYNGSSWVSSMQPGSQARPEVQRQKMGAPVRAPSAIRRFFNKIAAILIFVVGSLFVGYFGLGLGEFLANFENSYLPFIGAGLVWVIGLIYIWRSAREVWREE